MGDATLSQGELVLPETVEDLPFVHIQILQQKQRESSPRAQVWRVTARPAMSAGEPARAPIRLFGA
jgi:hypothetical protein